MPVAKKRKILVLTYRTGQDYHAPGAAGYLILLREAAKKYGGFELTEAYKPDGIDAKMLAGFDTVVINCQQSSYRQGKYGVEWRKAQRTPAMYTPEYKELINKRRVEEQKVWGTLHCELLPAYVKNGGGLIGIHAPALIEMSKADKATEYGVMLGGVVDDYCHPWMNGKIAGGGTYNGFTAKILEPSNPLTFAFRDVPPPKGFATELFSFWLPKACMDSSRTLVRVDYEKIPGMALLS